MCKKVIKITKKIKIMKYYWNEETIEYFKNRNKPGCEGQFIREIEEFVKNNCDLEEGEVYQDLMDDLKAQVKAER